MKRRTRSPSLRRLAAASAAAILAGAFHPTAEGGDGGAPPTGWMQNFSFASPTARAPDTPFLDRDGRSYTLEDFGGKVVLVNFWATWCAPCRREMPSLLRLSDRLAGTDLTVLALSQDRHGWDRIASFLETHGLERLAVYRDPRGATARAAGVRALPTTLLVGRDGREVGRLVGHAEWDSEEAVTLIERYLRPARSRTGPPVSHREIRVRAVHGVPAPRG